MRSLALRRVQMFNTKREEQFVRLAGYMGGMNETWKRAVRRNSVKGLLSAMCLCALVQHAAAEAAIPSDEETVSRDDCVLAPDAEDLTELVEGTSDTATDRMAECDGILAPPPTGDDEFVKPAPDTGAMPVVPPEVLPETPPSE